jgi:hypothetical protein
VLVPRATFQKRHAAPSIFPSTPDSHLDRSKRIFARNYLTPTITQTTVLNL